MTRPTGAPCPASNAPHTRNSLESIPSTHTAHTLHILQGMSSQELMCTTETPITALQSQTGSISNPQNIKQTSGTVSSCQGQQCCLTHCAAKPLVHIPALLQMPPPNHACQHMPTQAVAPELEVAARWHLLVKQAGSVWTPPERMVLLHSSTVGTPAAMPQQHMATESLSIW